MVTVTIHLDHEPPRVTTLLIRSTGERFITVHSGDATLIVHGYDGTAVASARQLAAALTACADQLDADLAATPAAVGGV